MKPSKPLSDKQLRFCQEYLTNGMHVGNAIKAAGYKSNNTRNEGCRMLKLPAVKHYLDEQRKKMEEEFEITKAWKMKKLKKCVEECLPDEVNHIDPKAAQTGVRAIAELNKMQGHYEPEKTLNFNIETTEELLKKYERPY